MSRKKLENRGLNVTKIDILKMPFNMRGFPPMEPGMGSLEPVTATSQPLLAYEKAELCHGAALVRLTPENYESVWNGKDTKRLSFKLIPMGKGRKPVQAVALRAGAHVRLAHDPCPSVRYMKYDAQVMFVAPAMAT
jgi:hypothetical protein